MPGPNTDRWLRVRYGGALSGWGYIFGLSWNAASIYVLTPWIGLGFNYEAPVIWAVGPYTKTGIWLGWGKQPVMQDGVRYKHSTEHKLIRYCTELEEYYR